jgi:uncharacterized protein YjdB
MTKKIQKTAKGTRTDTSVSAGRMAAVGRGVAALGAGAYNLLGPQGKTNQKKAKAIVGSMLRTEKEGALQGWKDLTAFGYPSAERPRTASKKVPSVMKKVSKSGGAKKRA